MGLEGYYRLGSVTKVMSLMWNSDNIIGSVVKIEMLMYNESRVGSVSKQGCDHFGGHSRSGSVAKVMILM